MEQYQNLGQAIERIKLPIIWTAATGTVLQLGLLIVSIMVAQTKDEIPYTSLEACHFGMKSIMGNAPDQSLVTSQVISDLTSQNFKIEEITLVKVIDPYLCDVVVRDTKGFRSYAVTLEKNLNFPHLYRILDVKGQKITSDYQLGNNL